MATFADFTPHQQLRALLQSHATMNEVERMAREGRIHGATYRRFLRLWAVSTATEHPYTSSWSLERWRSRRARVTAAVRAIAPPVRTFGA
jgi:hypothetical protein